MRAVSLVLLAACNQVYDLDETDAVDDLPCAAGAPFVASAAVPIAGTNSVEAARFTRNRAVAYLSLCPPNPTDPLSGCELYTSTYSVETEEFSGFSKMNGVSIAGVYDSYPTITSDNQHLVFSSKRDGTFHIWVATSVNGSFDAPTLTKLLGTDNMLVNEPYVVGREGRVLYFSGETGRQLYRMEGDAPTFGGSFVPVAGTDIPGIGEAAPVVRDSELEIFFGAGASIADFDLYRAERATITEPFGTPVKIENISSAGIDYPVWISPEGCDLYYINKVAGVATLYVAHR